MKIRFWDRLILFLGAVLTILAGAALIVAGLQIQGLLSELPVWVRALCIAAGLLVASFGGYLIVFPRRYAAKRNEFVIQRTENGELRIAVKAIENLVQKCLDLHEEIQVLSMKILNSREGVVVDLCVSLANNISIPLAIASLQKQIKQYLIASSGIEVKEVRVSVESTQDAPDAPAPECAEAACPAKEKLPLHQRLFGTPDQPATVPEPPREEAEQEAEVPAEPEAEVEPAPAEPEEETAEADAPKEEAPEEAVPEEAPTDAEGVSESDGDEPIQADAGSPETEETLPEGIEPETEDEENE